MKDGVRKCSGIGGRSVDETVVRFTLEAEAKLDGKHSQQSFKSSVEGISDMGTPFR